MSIDQQVTNAELPQTPIQYATASQKEEIIRLLNHPMITRQEKTKMLLSINRMDEERATIAIAKMRKAIEDRESGVAEMPAYVPPLVTSRTFTFYDLQTCTTREADMRKRVFPNWVQKKSMTQEKSELEIEMMERLTVILRGLSTGELRLIHASTGKQVTESQAGSFDRYIDIG